MQQRTLCIDNNIIYCFEDGTIEFICTKGKGKHLSNTKGYTTSEGYKQVRINNKTYYVHKLIALAFIPNLDNKSFIDHINRNKADNRISNLRWVTRSENESNKDIVDKSIELYGTRWKDDPIKYRHERQKHCLRYIHPNGKQSQTGYLSEEEYNNLKGLSQKERYYKYITLKGRSSNE